MLRDHFTSNYKAILMPTQMPRYAPMGNFYGSMYPLQKCASWPKYALGKLWPLHGNQILKEIFMCQIFDCTSGEKTKSH